MTKILLVEDDPTLSEIYQEVLTEEHFDVKPVFDGSQALATARAFKPDLILLDLLLPGIDGSALLPLFKNDAELKHIPIIIFSNISSTEKIKELMTNGASDYILKVDVTPDQVVERVRKVLHLPTPTNEDRMQN